MEKQAASLLPPTRVARTALEEAVLNKMFEFAQAGATGINFGALVDVPKVTTLAHVLDGEPKLLNVTVTLGYAVRALFTSRSAYPQFLEIKAEDEVEA